MARRSKKTIAVECMNDAVIKKYILKLVGKIVRGEIKKLCSVDAQSILQKGDSDALKSFYMANGDV